MNDTVNVYLAGSWESQSELKEVRDVLQTAGNILVTSRWLDKVSEWPEPNSPNYAEIQARDAAQDSEDVAISHYLLVDMSKPSTQHGRYYEAGLAAGLGTPIIVVGEPDCHFLRRHKSVPDWESVYRIFGVIDGK